MAGGSADIPVRSNVRIEKPAGNSRLRRHLEVAADGMFALRLLPLTGLHVSRLRIAKLD